MRALSNMIDHTFFYVFKLVFSICLPRPYGVAPAWEAPLLEPIWSPITPFPACSCSSVNSRGFLSASFGPSAGRSGLTAWHFQSMPFKNCQCKNMTQLSSQHNLTYLRNVLFRIYPLSGKDRSYSCREPPSQEIANVLGWSEALGMNKTDLFQTVIYTKEPFLRYVKLCWLLRVESFTVFEWYSCSGKKVLLLPGPKEADKKPREFTDDTSREGSDWTPDGLQQGCLSSRCHPIRSGQTNREDQLENIEERVINHVG